MDTLDRDLLGQTILILEEARTQGFSSLSSPVEPLLEVMVDLCLQLKQLLQEGTITWERRSNKTLKFSNFQVDALSNPKVITSEKRRSIAWNPSISFFFEELAKTLIRLKREHQLPKDLYSKGRGAQNPGQKEKQINNTAVYQFNRRSRLRRKKSQIAH